MSAQTVYIICPDCETVCPVKMTLAYIDEDGSFKYLSFAKCPSCHEMGDTRSIRIFSAMEPEMASYSLQALPVLAYG